MKVCMTSRKPLQILYCPCIVKFPQDHIDYEDDRFRIVCEGYILNHDELIKTYSGCTLREIIIQQYQQGGMSAALNLLRGSFVLAIQDKATGVTCIGNDMLSKQPLFYLKHSDGLMADSSFLSLLKDAKTASLPLTINPKGINEMLSRCSFLDDDTYVREIRFLERLQYLQITSDGLSIESYAYQPSAEIPDDEEILMDRIDHLFTEACHMAVEKNLSTGYRPAFTLSAGMDSRCAFLKSIPLCKKPDASTPLCMSYGAAGCMDIQIASSLAHAQGCDLLIHEINPTGFIRDRETLLEQNEGMMYYAGTTGLNGMLRVLNTSSLGLVITGLGGGEIMGDLSRSAATEAEEDSLYQQLFYDLIPDEHQRNEYIRQLQKKYASYNEYVSYQDIRTCHNFAYTSRKAFETFSPFLYEDLFLLLLKIPQEKKTFRRLYAKWYLRHIGDPTPTSCFQGPVRVTSPHAPDQLVKGALRRAKRMLHIQSKWDMNPIARWVQDHPQNRIYMEQTLAQDLSLLCTKQPQLAEKLKTHYETADADSQLRVLTISGMAARIVR